MFEKVKKFIKKNWKWIILVIGAISAVLFVKRTITAIIGKVSKSTNFREDHDDKTKMYVKDGDGWRIVKLPIDKKGNQITYKNVKAAGLSKSKTGETKVTVEIKHEVTDRRTGSRIDNSAGSRLSG